LVGVALVLAATLAPMPAEAAPVPVTVRSVPPAVGNSSDVTFSVSYDLPPTATQIGFFCEVDRPGVWEPGEVCGSPFCTALPCGFTRTFQGLGEGDWVFRVRAYEPFDLSMLGPVTSYPFRIDRIAPFVMLTQVPQASTTETSATFVFDASEPSTFECDLDGARAACTSPASHTVGVGRHSFSVTPKDTAGNIGAVALARWDVTPTMALATVRLTGIKWNRSTIRPGARLMARGSLTPGSYAAMTSWSLRHRAVPKARLEFARTIQPRRFNSRVPLPRSARGGEGLLVPGEYRLVGAGTGAGFAIPSVERRVVIPAPPEGVVSTAGVSTVPGGPPLRFVSKARELWATFRFAPGARPKKKYVGEWRDPRGRRVGRFGFSRRRGLAILGYSGQRDLAPGIWRCTLRMGKRVIEQVGIRVG
jgi:hypothetical protein